METNKQANGRGVGRWGWLKSGLGLIMVLLISEVIYIAVNQPPEYIGEFYKMSLWGFEKQIERQKTATAWVFLQKAVELRQKIHLENEEFGSLTFKASLPDYQMNSEWLARHAKEVWLTQVKSTSEGQRDLAKYLSALGENAEQDERLALADDFYETAIAVEPAWGTYRVNLARVKIKRGDEEAGKGILAECLKIDEAADDCKAYSDELKRNELIFEARKAYESNNGLLMEETLFKVYDLLGGEEKYGTMSGQMRVSNIGADKLEISKEIWDLLETPNDEINMAKFAYSLALRKFRAGVGSEEVWFKRARFLGGDWSSFHLEEINYLRAKGMVDEARLVLADCLQSYNAGSACRDYETETWDKGIIEPVGRYEAEIMNDVK